MSELIRYDLTEDVEHGFFDITPVPNSMEGRFVTYEDYASLQQKLDSVMAEREKFAVQCAAARIAVQYAKAAGFECTLNTPDVDNYLNAVRAEGVEMFDKHFNCHDISDDIMEFANKLRTGKDGE